MKKKTLVIGASEKPERYSNKAIKMLRSHSHPVVAIAPRTGKVEDVGFDVDRIDYPDIDTVTLYVGPRHQPEFYNYLVSLRPRRIIFNPGTENAEFAARLSEAGIQYEEACTLVLLANGNY
jgi:hypothetical protein